MNLLWFWIAVALAISDEIHSRIVWKIGQNFYIIFAGVIDKTMASIIQAWIVHEVLEAIFHFNTCFPIITNRIFSSTYTLHVRFST